MVDHHGVPDRHDRFRRCLGRVSVSTLQGPTVVVEPKIGPYRGSANKAGFPWDCFTRFGLACHDPVMAVGLKLTRRERVAGTLGRAVTSWLWKRKVSSMNWEQASGEDDGGTAGVREPRRPRPDLPSLSAEAAFE